MPPENESLLDDVLVKAGIEPISKAWIKKLFKLVIVLSIIAMIINSIHNYRMQIVSDDEYSITILGVVSYLFIHFVVIPFGCFLLTLVVNFIPYRKLKYEDHF